MQLETDETRRSIDAIKKGVDMLTMIGCYAGVMADRGKSRRPLLKRGLVIGTWVIGAWAPIQTAYETISKGTLSWMGVTTSLGLFQVLTNLCRTAGAGLVVWIVSTVVNGATLLIPYHIVSAVFLAIFPRFKTDAHNGAKYYWICIAAGSAIECFVIMCLAKANPLRSLGFKFHWGDWVLSGIGGAMLGFAYVRAYMAIKKGLAEIEEEKKVPGLAK